MNAAERTQALPSGRRKGIPHRVDVALRALGSAFVGLVVVFLLAPAVLTIVLSFSGDSFFAFPPESWGLRQYKQLFSSPDWLKAVRYSFEIALPVALICGAISVPTVVVMGRSRLPGRSSLLALGMTGLIIPISAYAVAMYAVFAQFGLLGTYQGLVIANTVIALPLMLVVVAAAMSRIPRDLELAAMVCGASRLRSWLGVTLPLLVPALLAGGILAFITSFDEAVFINFVGGPGQTTLPKAIFDSVRFGVDPMITAIATLLMAATSALMLLALSRRER